MWLNCCTLTGTILDTEHCHGKGDRLSGNLRLATYLSKKITPVSVHAIDFPFLTIRATTRKLSISRNISRNTRKDTVKFTMVHETGSNTNLEVREIHLLSARHFEAGVSLMAANVQERGTGRPPKRCLPDTRKMKLLNKMII